MTTPRSVSEVVPAPSRLEGGGFLVHRPFPGPELPLVDPFLLLDEMGPVEYGPGEALGAPDHPHRGFETVTYMLEGSFEHEDSAGHSGRLEPGSVQWMTAGAGVVHSEMPSAQIRRDGGRVHGFQLWVNLPARAKMTSPRYQELGAAQIPVVETHDGVVVRVIAGEVQGSPGPVETHTPVTYLHVTLPPGTMFAHPVPSSHNAIAYRVTGTRDGELVVFAPDGEAVEVAAPPGAESPVDVLLLAGEPLREPVARYGPFVMTTKAEIAQAIEDFQAGRLGAIAR